MKLTKIMNKQISIHVFHTTSKYKKDVWGQSSKWNKKNNHIL